MPEPQLSVRSARARELAHRLAARERRSVAQVVEMALELYAHRHHGGESGEAFIARLGVMARDLPSDPDLAALIAEDRAPHDGPSL